MTARPIWLRAEVSATTLSTARLFDLEARSRGRALQLVAWPGGVVAWIDREDLARLVCPADTTLQAVQCEQHGLLATVPLASEPAARMRELLALATAHESATGCVADVDAWPVNSGGGHGNP
jgi:hypothetical protein